MCVWSLGSCRAQDLICSYLVLAARVFTLALQDTLGAAYPCGRDGTERAGTRGPLLRSPPTKRPAELVGVRIKDKKRVYEPVTQDFSGCSGTALFRGTRC